MPMELPLDRNWVVHSMRSQPYWLTRGSAATSAAFFSFRRGSAGRSLSTASIRDRVKNKGGCGEDMAFLMSRLRSSEVIDRG